MSAAALRGSEPLAPGDLVAGRYRLAAILGQGAFATVFRAVDEPRGGEVALKVLDPLRAPDELGRARLHRELDALGRVRHRGVARALGLVEEDELHALVLELVEGPTLEARLARGRLDPDEALAIGAQIAAALEACHAAGVLHRDLKPENVTLHPQRGAVLLDFGLAWYASAAGLTRTGAVVGSPRHLAPEVLAGAPLDARTDVYAAGAIVFELLTGRPAQLADTIAALARAQQLGGPPRVSMLRPGVPPGLDDVIAQALSPRPEDRFATAAELGRALRLGRAPVVHASCGAPCPRCHVPALRELDFCAGCGQPRGAALEPGRVAVVLQTLDAAACVRWLVQDHPRELSLKGDRLLGRLGRPPVLLARSISEGCADALVAETSSAGCEAEAVRLGPLSGAALRAVPASRDEVIGLALAHLAVVVAIGLSLRLAGAADEWLILVPTAVSVVALVLAWVWVRRPLLRPTPGTPSPAAPRLTALRARLERLRSPRARHLAAGAIARALRPLRTSGNPAACSALEALERALTAAADVDCHAELLTAVSRTRLAQELELARMAAARGDEDAFERVIALESQASDLEQAALAHDLAVRVCLEADRRSAALRLRVRLLRHRHRGGVHRPRPRRPRRRRRLLHLRARRQRRRLEQRQGLERHLHRSGAGMSALQRAGERRQARLEPLEALAHGGGVPRGASPAELQRDVAPGERPIDPQREQCLLLLGQPPAQRVQDRLPARAFGPRCLPRRLEREGARDAPLHALSPHHAQGRVARERHCPAAQAARPAETGQPAPEVLAELRVSLARRGVVPQERAEHPTDVPAVGLDRQRRRAAEVASSHGPEDRLFVLARCIGHAPTGFKPGAKPGA